MALYRLGYGRVSSADQNLDRQVYLFEQLGTDELFLEKISGGRRDRPEFLRLVDRALELRQQGHQVEIVVLDLTRWARDISYSLETIERLEDAGVKIREGASEPLSLRTAAGFLEVGAKSLFSHYFRLTLSDQGRKAYERKRKEGKPWGAPVPLGYARQPDQSAFAPGKTWGIARAAVDKFLAGSSLMELARWLYQEHGIKRSPQGLGNWLKNPLLRGHIHYPGTGETFYNSHPALISEGEHQAILQRMEQNRCLRGANKGKTYPVPGVVYCAGCGLKCNSSVNKTSRYFYCYRAKRGDCSAPKTYCRQDVIEAAIQEAILEAAETIAADLLAPGTTDPRIATLEAEAAGLRPFAGRAGIAAEIEAIEREVVQLKVAQGNQAAGDAELREAIQAMALVDWEGLSQEDRRAIYGALVERVTVEGGEVVEVVVKGVG